MNTSIQTIRTPQEPPLSLATFLLLISLFITIGGTFANQALQHIQKSFSTMDMIMIPLLAILFYAVGTITQKV